MDRLFDRLGNLLRSMLQDSGNPGRNARSHKFEDPDMAAAWDELDDFLRTGENPGGGTRTGNRFTDGAGYHPSGRNSSGTPPIPKELERDYRNLELAPGASFDEVRRSYKRLLGTYHPDRHAGDPEKMKTATEITQRINESFQRIRRYRETGRL